MSVEVVYMTGDVVRHARYSVPMTTSHCFSAKRFGERENVVASETPTNVTKARPGTNLNRKLVVNGSGPAGRKRPLAEASRACGGMRYAHVFMHPFWGRPPRDGSKDLLSAAR